MAETRLPALDDREIPRRAPVWHALSDLFRDTEMQEVEHRSIADTIRKAGYSLGEAEAILRDEVAPIFYVNMLSAVGEWAGWPEDYVREKVLARLKARAGLSKLWRRLSFMDGVMADRRLAMVRRDWDEIKRILAEPAP